MDQKEQPSRTIDGFNPESIRKWSGRFQSRERKEQKRLLKRRGIKPAKRQWMIRVDTTAITIPQWAKEAAEPKLSQGDRYVWFRGRSAGYHHMLARADRLRGGRPDITHVEYRECKVCGRLLLGLEAQGRRKLDESSADGRSKPCSAECAPSNIS